MTKFSLENHKMAEFSRGMRAVNRLDQRASAQLGHGSIEAHAVDWSMQGHREAWAHLSIT
jgi:hypothetical protein